jgi:hypothetical protein
VTILVVGDSLSYGAELSDLPGTHAGLFGNDYWDPVALQAHEHPPSRLAWPQLLGNRLGHSVHNLSLIGGSNSRIHRVTMSAVAQQPYDLVICAWTQLTRIDVTYQGRECPVAANNPKWPWVKNYFADHYSTEQELERQLALVLSLQSFLQVCNQPYVFVDAIRWLYGRDIPNHLVKLVDLAPYAFWGTSLMDMCVAAGVSHGWGGHFLEAGHALVAERVFDYLHSNNYAITL